MRTATGASLQASPTAADEAMAPVERVAPDDADWHRLQQAIRSLPDKQREVITLKIDGELTFAQIAQVMGVSISTAASRYHYALKKLKTSLVGARTSRGGETVMEDLQLPPELERVERLLACGPRPEPSAALRRRVLGGVRSELRSGPFYPRGGLPAAFAATLLVGLGLSLGVLQATGFALQQRESPPSVYEVARRLQQLSPGLSREESLRQAAIRHIGAEVSRQTPLGEIPSRNMSIP